jgi:hypothetical protein
MEAAMFKRFFKRGRTQEILGNPATLSSGDASGKWLPCEVWTEFGVGRWTEAKLVRPCPFVKLLMQKSRA